MAQPTPTAIRSWLHRAARKAAGLVFALCVLFALAITAAIALGGPGQPVPMASINTPFKDVNFADLPQPRTYTAADGKALSYRLYPASGPRQGAVVLVHGSSASGASMHVLAKGLRDAGYDAYTLDIRGHGLSGAHGDIAYIGQLDDDLRAFMQTVQPARPNTLLGFSSGGGFALRVAASSQQSLFDGYLLLSPFLGHQAPTYKPDAAGWARVGMPRIVALTVLNQLGVHTFNGLTVIRYALDARAQKVLTPSYSFNLLSNFGPPDDLPRAISRVQGRMAVVVGSDDELFAATQFAPTIRAAGAHWPVQLVPGLGHITLTLQPAGIAAAVGQLRAQALAGQGSPG
jgi:non-heme chloroperoxidase